MAKPAPERQNGKGEDAARHGNLRLFGRRASLQSPTEALQPQPAPPVPARRRRRPRSVLSTISGFLSFLLVLGIVAVAMVGHGTQWFLKPGPLADEKVVYIAYGTGRGDIVDQLEKEGVIDNGLLFNAGLVYASLKNGFSPKADEYLFKSHATPEEVLDTLVEPTTQQNSIILKEGQSVADLKALPERSAHLRHSISMPEGLTSEQMMQRLKNSEILNGDVHIPAEGTLMPDTYVFSHGDRREAIVKRMQDEQKKVLSEVWAGRAPDSPLRSAQDLVTLAAIVEKETGKPDERARVAGVFLNRLARHMKLQSDPTIIYGLVGGKGTLGRPILASEVKEATPYNTYVIDGLPPGPICNPGRAAMEAVANPAKSKELYFVADGTGGHAFAETIDEHLKNVARWRQIEKDTKDKIPPEADKPATAKPLQKTEDEGDAPASEQFAAAIPGDAAGAAAAAPASATALADASAGVLSLGKFQVKFGPAVDSQGWRIPGMDADEDSAQGDSTDAPGGDGSLASYPMSPARLAELRARQARWGIEPTASTQMPAEQAALRQPATLVADPLFESCHTAGGTPSPRALDASEGTPLDPLLNTTFDLNSTKAVPSKPLVFASTDDSAGPHQDQTASWLLRGSYSESRTETAAQCDKTLEADLRSGLPSESGEAAAPAGLHGRIVDVSEGTRLDPLLNHTFDLNSPQTVPTKPVIVAGLDDRAGAHIDAGQPLVRGGDLRPRPRVFDASEGTPLDPLLNKTFDLNSPHTVPTRSAMRDVLMSPAAPAGNAARVKPGSATRSPPASSE